MGPGAQPPPGRRSSATPWIVVACVVLLGAVAAIILVMSNKKGNSAAPVGPDGGNTVAVTSGGVRAYPSMEISVDPAQTQQQAAANEAAVTWVQAVNNEDIDAARTLMCAQAQSMTLEALLRGVAPGSLKVDTVAVNSNGKNASLAMSFETSSGETLSGTIPMVLEDTWKVCLRG